MRTNRKRGFTIVELVVVIAIIAVLAAVLIPTFTSIIKKANDSAYLQERQSQQIADLAEKVEKINYFTWEDFEKKLAEELAKINNDTVTKEDVTAAVDAALKEYAAYSQASMTGLTADQVKKIVDEAMAGQLTTAQVEAIVKAAVGNKSVDVNAIANQVIAKLPKTTGITKEEMQKAINEALSGVEGVTEADIAKALAAFGASTLTEEDINGIISSATSDNTTLAKALNIRLANLGIGKQKTVYDMVVKIGGESVITGTNTTSTVLDDTSTLLYDLENNKFFTVKNGVVDYNGGLSISGELTDAYKYWSFFKEISGTYSTYLLSGSEVTSAVVTKGVDVGYKTDVTSITYERSNETSAQTVVIRTNSAGTTLTINGYVDPNDSTKGDTVKHYGAVGSLVINSVASASYHEYGKVAFAEISTGRIVLESKSEVEHIHLTATNGEFVDITVAKASDVEMPEFSRDPVEIPAEGKLVVALQDGTDKDEEKDYVWLTAVGIYEQVTVSDSKDDAKNNYAATSTTASQEQKTAAQQIANNITFSKGGQDYKVTATTTDNGATWTYEVKTEDGESTSEFNAEASGNTVTVTSTATSEPVSTTTENGSDKAEEKSKYVAELISNDAELREFLAGTKQKGKLANNVSNPTVETKSTRYVYANGRNVELDLAGFTLDGYEICVNDGSTLTLTGNGVINLDDEEAVVIYNGTLVLAGAKITGNPEYSAPLLFANYDDNGYPSNCKLVVADDTANYIETSGDGASGIMVLAYYGDMNLTINGQEKHNGQLFVTAKTEDAWAAIRPHQGGANSTTIIDGLYIELSTESDTYEVIDGTGDVLIKTVSGSFSGNVTEHCQAGYCSKLNNGTGRYEIKLLTEEDATFKITSKSGAETLIAGSIYQAMALATEESTITVLKNCNITETAWNAPGVGADYFTIDLNGKTISGNDLSIKRPDPRNSNNVTMPVHVTVTNGTMSNGLMLYTYSYVTVSNVHFTNTTSSYATAININSNIKTNVYDWAEPGTNSITLNNCTFENKYIKLYGSNEGQKIDLTMTNCTMSKTYNGYNSMIEANSYVYGTISLNGCTLNGSFNNAYTYPIKIESTSSSNGGNMVTLNLQDVEINVTGSSTKPVSIGSSWTVNEEGTNVYTVGGNAKNYDGSAIE